MTESLHHPETVEAVAKKVFSLVNPLGSLDELTEDQRSEWEAEAVQIIDLAIKTPTNGIAFFEETHDVPDSPGDLLGPWEGLVSTGPEESRR